MAKINIKDLADSIDLDRKAMLAISGGARVRGKQASATRTSSETVKLVDYPPGFDKGVFGNKGEKAQ